ncbi:unnamed protein product [Brachionus calyciflorus]|uniref:UDP-glucuronosyltransferase n=1 Tax=Brachionus calyciflorus TaxID=104777 RepID=A0A813MB02_9BILA|nr:unnamed protein product [Brachionus calyciflorus]
MEQTKKIFIMVLPSFGHINPITGLASELVLKQKYEIFFYGNDEHKDVIERTGAIFRQYENMLISESKIKPLNEEKHDAMEGFFLKMINYCYKSVPTLIQDLELEKPDLIIFDHMSLPARFAIKILETRFQKGLIKNPPPPAVNFYTCFASKKGVYPNDEQIKEMAGSGIQSLTSLAKIIYKQTIFSWKFGINIYNPIEFINKPEKLNIVGVSPELHPFSEHFDSSFKFVGPCISEKVRKSQNFEPKLKEILDLFPIVGSDLTKRDEQSNLRLIYASLGTVFNNNLFIFDMIIEAIRLYNEDKGEENSYDSKVVISVGKDNMKIYDEKVETDENFHLPENVLIMASVPQIDVLERASVFITHCGMNSACEAIQYGVPVICLPIKADQPLVAHRLADDLNLGIRFDPLNVTPKDLKSALDKILRENSYLERMLSFTKISHEYNGSASSANLIEQFLNELYSSN